MTALYICRALSQAAAVAAVVAADGDDIKCPPDMSLLAAVELISEGSLW